MANWGEGVSFLPICAKCEFWHDHNGGKSLLQGSKIGIILKTYHSFVLLYISFPPHSNAPRWHNGNRYNLSKSFAQFPVLQITGKNMSRLLAPCRGPCPLIQSNPLHYFFFFKVVYNYNHALLKIPGTISFLSILATNALFPSLMIAKLQKKKPGPEVIKLFSCSTQLSMKFQLLIKTKMLKN